MDVDDGYPPKELETHHRLNAQILEMATALAISESADLHVVSPWESVNEMVGGLFILSNIPRERLADSIARERRQQQRLLDEFIRT